MKFNPVTYSEKVLESKNHGELYKLTCKRFLKDWDSKKDKGWIYDKKAAERFYKFSGLCNHWKPARYYGKPILLEDFQKFFFGNLFGWKLENGLRRFRRSYKQVARKIFKSTEKAVQSLFHVSSDGEQGALVLVGSNREEQAKIVVNNAGRIVQVSPLLGKQFKVFWHGADIMKVYHPASSSLIVAMTKEVQEGSHDGPDPSMGVIDEYHAAKNSKGVDSISSGMGNRAQPLLDIITTAGYNIQGPCYRTRKLSIEILKNIKVDDAFYTEIWELDDNDDWHDQKTWIKANPRMKRDPLFKTYLLDQYTKAVNEGGGAEATFITKNLDKWTSSVESWITDDIWVQCNHYPLQMENFKDRPIYLGFSVSPGFSSLCIMSHNNENGKLDVFWKTWLPKDNADQNVLAWDCIDFTEGDIEDTETITNEVIEIFDNFNVMCLFFNRKYVLHGMIQKLLDYGYEVYPIAPSAAKFGHPIEELEKLMLSKDRLLNHGGNQAARWMMGNVYMKKNYDGLRYPVKEESQGPIDMVQAMIMAYAAYLDKQYEGAGLKLIVI